MSPVTSHPFLHLDHQEVGRINHEKSGILLWCDFSDLLGSAISGSPRAGVIL
jgi:hypothetical protein